jgi:hypothetical protein
MNVPNAVESDVFVAPKHNRGSTQSSQKPPKTGGKPPILTGGPAGAGWCSSCSPRHMETHKWLQRVALFVMVLIPVLPAQAHKLDRVRGDSEDLRLLISTGVERSPTFKAIVDRLEASDLIVEVQCGTFKSSLLAGRTVLLSARPSVRYVLVEIACPMSRAAALVILGHELRHALEIAAA